MLRYTWNFVFISRVKFVKKTVAHVSTGRILFNKFGKFLYKMPKRILKSFFIIQLKIMRIPLHLISSLYRFLFKRNAPLHCNQCKNSTSQVSASMTIVHGEERQKAVIQEVKDIRNVMLKAIDTVTGASILRQLERLNRSGKYIEEISEINFEEDNDERNMSTKHIKATKEKMTYNINTNSSKPYKREMPSMNQIHNCISFKETQTENIDFLNALEKSNVYEHAKSIQCDNKCLNYLKDNMALEEDNLDFTVDKKMLNVSEVFQNLMGLVTEENVLLRRRLSVTNSKLETVLVSSNSLLDELVKLNDHFRKLTTVSTRISNLQYELKEGRKLLCEVEADRNEMQQKLFALERLIKEEEEYLDDVSCESGYDETEILTTFSCKAKLL